MDISSLLHTIDVDNEHDLATEFEHPCGEDENESDMTYTSSFVDNLPNR